MGKPSQFSMLTTSLYPSQEIFIQVLFQIEVTPSVQGLRAVLAVGGLRAVLAVGGLRAVLAVGGLRAVLAVG